MKRIVFGGFIILILISFLYYFHIHSFFQFPLKIFTMKNTKAENSMLLMVSNTAKIGEMISVDIYYSPQIVRTYDLKNVQFIDAAGAFDTGVSLSDTFGFFPRHIHLNYKIPAAVCAQATVKDKCQTIAVKKGTGKIRISYDPQIRTVLEDGDGYQGEGESIEVGVDVK